MQLIYLNLVNVDDISRRHPQPTTSKLEELVKAISSFGLTLHYETSKALADSLDKAVVCKLYCKENNFIIIIILCFLTRLLYLKVTRRSIFQSIIKNIDDKMYDASRLFLFWYSFRARI